MKLTSYTLQQIEKEIKEELFRIWLDSKLKDWTNPDIRDIHILYHNLFKDEK